MSEYLRIVQGGHLRKRYWVPSEVAGEGQYRESDVTDLAPRKLFDVCRIQKGITLRDIFLLIQRHLPVYEAVIGNWVADLVDEGLNKPLSTDFVKDLDYLELYWRWEEDNDERTISGYHFPSFRGKCLRPDAEFANIGIELTAANELMPYEVRLRKTVTISAGHKETMKALKRGDPAPARERRCTYTLGQILYGIIWEMSFFGGPIERGAFTDRLRDVCDRPEKAEALILTADQYRFLELAFDGPQIIFPRHWNVGALLDAGLCERTEYGIVITDAGREALKYRPETAV